MTHWLKNICEFLALAGLVLGTFAFGGVLGWGLVLMAIPLVLAFCLLFGLRILPDPEKRPASGAKRWLWILLLLVGGYCMLQTLPLPESVLTALSPRRPLIESQYLKALERTAPKSLPVCFDRVATQDGLRLLGLGFMAFYLGAALGGTRRRAHRLLMGLLLLVLLEAIYGLGEDLSGRHSILGYDTITDVACGTFYNRNHFAALLAMFTPIALGWTYYKIRPAHQRWRMESAEPAGMNEGLFSKQGLWMLVPVVFMLGVIQSASRGGLSSMLLGSALFFALATRSRSVKAFSWITAALGIITLIYAFNSDYQIVLNRMDDLIENGEGREIIWKNSMTLFKDFPVCGVGLANFPKVFSRYSTVDTSVYPFQAHNEWLEGLVTLGVVGMSLVVLTVGSLLVLTYLDLRRRREGQLWRLGCWCGLIGLATHSFAEFNMHIPSICMTTFFIAGMLVGTMGGPKEKAAAESFA